MTTADMKLYLESLVELEGSVYRQREIIKEAKRKLVCNRPTKMDIQAPQKPEIVLYEPKLKIDSENEAVKTGKWIRNIGLFFAVFGGITLFAGIGADAAGAGLLLLGFLCLWGYRKGNANVKEKIKAKREEYDRAMEDYNKRKAAAEAAFPQRMEEYQKKLQAFNERKAALDKKYMQETIIAESNYTAGKNAIFYLESALRETEATLAKLYELDIVFPKYRGVVPMCTIYEYFASGRCTELEGPNGAYNLYEAELRQNLIINQLEKVNQNLEAIKDNQYMLYKELSQTNSILQKISTDVGRVATATQRIAEFSEVTAYCAQITAKNTEAIKYLSVVN